MGDQTPILPITVERLLYHGDLMLAGGGSV